MKVEYNFFKVSGAISPVRIKYSKEREKKKKSRSSTLDMRSNMADCVSLISLERNK